MPARFVNVATNVALVVGSTSVALLLLEGAVRIINPQPLAAVARSPRLGWVHRPNSDVIYQREEFRVPVHFSSAGLRDHEYAFDKPTNTWRIAMLGDSFVEAVQVPLDSCTAKRTEACLNARTADGRRYEVMNFGVSGYGTCQQLLLLEELALRYHPDVVISQFYANDLDDDARFGICDLDQRGDLHVAPARELSCRERTTSAAKSFLFQHSHLWMLVTTRRPRVIDPKAHATAGQEGHSAPGSTAVPSCPGRHRSVEWRLTLREPPPDLAGILALQGAIWERMAAVAAAHDARFLVVLGVSRTAVDPETYAQTLTSEGCRAEAHEWTLLRERVRTAAEERGVEVLDLLPEFRAHVAREPLHFQYDGHWNAAGHRVAAQALCDALLERGILQRVASTR